VKVLFITSNRIGDAVLSTGLLSWLVNHYTDALFTIACGPPAADLFRATPRLEKLIVLEKQPWNYHWLGLWRQTVCVYWDIIVDLRNSAISRLMFAEHCFYRTPNTEQHKVLENASALRLSPPPEPSIWVDADAEREAAALLPVGRPLLALGPAANWACKQWPIERFAQLAQKLVMTEGPLPHAAVLVIADEKERQQLTPLFNSIAPERCVQIIGRNLLTVAACLKKATLFVGNDSGLMHIAAAVGAPTLGLFGPGLEKIYGPWGPRCAFVRTSESRLELLKRLPPTGADVELPNLMEGLTVEKVSRAVTLLLSSR
jgi:heptosyltransferase-3